MAIRIVSSNETLNAPMREALNEADMYLQSLEELSLATLTAVRALLSQPDGISMRRSVLGLVAKLHDEVAIVMNEVNCSAEKFGVNYQESDSDFAAICAAVRGARPEVH